MNAFELALLVRAVPLPPVEKAVLLALALRTGKEGACWPGQELLASDTGFTSRAVRGAVERLVERKLISCTRGYDRRLYGAQRECTRSLVYRLDVDAIGAAGKQPQQPERRSALPRADRKDVPVTLEGKRNVVPVSPTAKEERPSGLQAAKAEPASDRNDVPPEPPSGGDRNVVPVEPERASGANRNQVPPKLTKEEIQEENTEAPEPPAGAGAGTGAREEPAEQVVISGYGLEGAAWAKGVSSVTKKGMTPPRGAQLEHLEAAIRVHCPPGENPCTWVADRGAAWARTGPRRVSVWTFAEWLDSGSPLVTPTRAGSRVSNIQHYDPNSPWLQPGYQGSR